MKRIVLMVIACFYMSQAQSALLTISPVAQSVVLGEQASVELRIEGLGNVSAPSLGGFDFTLMFDPVLLSLNAVSFGNLLGDEGAGEAFYQASQSASGTLDMLGLSFLFDFELDAIQSTSVTLATLVFDTTAIGTSGLSFGAYLFSDTAGGELSIGNSPNGSITITGPSGPVTVSAPGAMIWLLFVGLLLIRYFR